MPDTKLSEDLGRLLDHFAGTGPDHPPELSLVDHWVRSAEDLEDRVRRLTAERDAAVAQAQASGQEAAGLRGALGAMREEWGVIPEDIMRPEYLEHLRRVELEADAALATPPTAYAKLAAARADVHRRGQRWIERARQRKHVRDVGQDDWYDAYAEDSDALMQAIDAATEAEAAAGEGDADG